MGPALGKSGGCAQQWARSYPPPSSSQGCDSYLEGEFKFDQEREADGLQDALLIQSVFDLLQLHHLRQRRAVRAASFPSLGQNQEYGSGEHFFSQNGPDTHNLASAERGGSLHDTQIKTEDMCIKAPQTKGIRVKGESLGLIDAQITHLAKSGKWREPE